MWKKIAILSTGKCGKLPLKLTLFSKCDDEKFHDARTMFYRRGLNFS